MSEKMFGDVMEDESLEATFKQQELSSGDREEIPDGTYQCVVEKAYGERSKTSDKWLLKWTLGITAGKYAGRKLFRNNGLSTPENMKWLKQDLYTCGVTINSLKELPDALDRLIGVHLECKVVSKPGAGGQQYRNVYLQKKIAVAASRDVDGDIPF